MAEPLVSHQSAIKRVLLAGVRTSIQNLFRQAEWQSSSAKHPRKTLPPSATPGKTNVEAGLSPQIFLMQRYTILLNQPNLFLLQALQCTISLVKTKIIYNFAPLALGMTADEPSFWMSDAVSSAISFIYQLQYGFTQYYLFR